MTDTSRMVIVPTSDENGNCLGSATLAYVVSIQTKSHGKISREDLERARIAADSSSGKACTALYVDDAPISVITRAWQDAFAAALGLEIAEDGENG